MADIFSQLGSQYSSRMKDPFCGINPQLRSFVGKGFDPKATSQVTPLISVAIRAIPIIFGNTGHTGNTTFMGPNNDNQKPKEEYTNPPLFNIKIKTKPTSSSTPSTPPPPSDGKHSSDRPSSNDKSSSKFKSNSNFPNFDINNLESTIPGIKNFSSASQQSSSSEKGIKTSKSSKSSKSSKPKDADSSKGPRPSNTNTKNSDPFSQFSQFTATLSNQFCKHFDPNANPFTQGIISKNFVDYAGDMVTGIMSSLSKMDNDNGNFEDDSYIGSCLRSNMSDDNSMKTTTNAKAKTKAKTKSAKAKKEEENEDLDSEDNINKIKFKNGKIIGRYDHDLNILQIHQMILNYFDVSYEKRISDASIRVKELYDIVNHPQSRNERCVTLDNYNRHKKKLDDIAGRVDEKNYRREVSELIKGYEKLGPIKTNSLNISNTSDPSNHSNNGVSERGSSQVECEKDFDVVSVSSLNSIHSSNSFSSLNSFRSSRSFEPRNSTGLPTKIPSTSDDDSYRHQIISRYLEIAKKHFNIDVSRIIHNIILCPECKSQINDENYKEQSQNGNIEVCPACGEELTTLIGSSSGSADSKNSDKDWEHILKRLIELQGYQKDNIPKDTYNLLDEYFEKNGFPTGEKIRNSNTIKIIDLGLGIKIKSGTSIKMMLEALGELEMSSLYKDAYLICRNYWGWELINLSSIENMMSEFFHEFRGIYDSIKGMRSSFLNRDYVIFRLLEQTGNYVEPIYFKMIETEGSFQYHEETWLRGCKKLEWNIIPKKLTSNTYF